MRWVFGFNRVNDCVPMVRYMWMKMAVVIFRLVRVVVMESDMEVVVVLIAVVFVIVLLML